jgi:hypothetical protein
VGQESRETVSTAFVVRPPPCSGGNEARDVSDGSSIVKTAESVREKPEVEHHLREEKVRDSLWSYSSVVLGPRVSYPLHRAPLMISRYLVWF